ncbi:MAG: hypothetical protein EU548_08320 [Promethearchaeota archaeon]|nr:MAG: hypothetical protein EU548_08320 [Candidatus Lokiarchaeota archaeon]
MNNRNDKNPFNICIWKDISECTDCKIKGKLQCHYEMKYTIWFIIPFLTAFVPIIIGYFIGLFFGNLNLFLFLIGLIGQIIYAIFFFLVWEPRILCRHCPYYAEGNTTLHCYANYGFKKPVSFDPNPMNKSEKIQFILAIAIFVSFSIPFLITGLIGLQYILLVIAIIGIISWLFVLFFKICPKCVNFSCPLNRVPKEMVHEFLNRNEIMKKAWENQGN